MRTVAKVVCQVLYTLRVWHCFLAFEKRFGWRRHALVLLYHHIRADDETVPPLSQVEEGVTQSTLDIQLREFRRWYEPCTAAEFPSLLDSESVPSDHLLVTFDDGYRDNRTLAGPILRRHGFTGLIFIATGYIGTSRRFWWTRVNDIVRSYTPESLAAARATFNGKSQLTPVLNGASVDDHPKRRQFRIHVAEKLDRMGDQEQQTELDHLEAVTERANTTCMPLLEWSEIRKMRDEGFEFGAHTVNHPRLTRLTSEDQQQEILSSVQTLMKELGEVPETFAYPYGDYNSDVEAEVRRTRLKVAFAANPGSVKFGKTDKFKIPRIQLGVADPVRITVLIAALKLSKYLPRPTRWLLTKFFGEPFEI